MEKYNKAIVAVLGALVTIFGPKVPGLRDALNPEVIQAIALIITTLGVYLVPNKLGGENVIDLAKKPKTHMTEDTLPPRPVDYPKDR